MAQGLQARSVYIVPLLPDRTSCTEFSRFATTGGCRRQGRPPTFKASDVVGGRLPTGELAVLADVLDADRNEAVLAVIMEPSFIEVASQVPRVCPDQTPGPPHLEFCL